MIAATAVALATPVAAQDMASDYREAYTRIWGEAEVSAVAAAEIGLSILPTIAGTWIDAGFLMRGADLDADLVTSGCGFTPLVITNVGDYGFQTEMTRRGEPTGDVRTYMFSTGSYYSFLTDLNGYLGTLTAGQELSNFSTEQVLGWLQSGTSGVARVEAVGHDVLMIDSPNGASMVLVRCP